MVQLQIDVKGTHDRWLPRWLLPLLLRIVTLSIPIVVVAFDGHVKIEAAERVDH